MRELTHEACGKHEASHLRVVVENELRRLGLERGPIAAPAERDQPVAARKIGDDAALVGGDEIAHACGELRIGERVARLLQASADRVVVEPGREQIVRIEFGHALRKRLTTRRVACLDRIPRGEKRVVGGGQLRGQLLRIGRTGSGTRRDRRRGKRRNHQGND